MPKICGSRTCKPNSVCRIAPAGRSFLWAEHYCAAQATYPEVVARRAGTRPRRTRGSLPIWSCSVWGLPCPPHYCDGGALLPHLFTLTPALPPRRYVLCGTFRKPGLNPDSRTLSGTLLCGVRTFLPRHLTQQERPSGPAANRFIVTVVGRQSSVVKGTGPRIFTDSHGSKSFVFYLLDLRKSVKSVAAFQFGRFLSSFWIFQKALGRRSLTGGSADSFWCGSVWYQKATLV